MDLFVRFLNPVLMILLGLGVGILVSHRFRQDWRLYGIGAATFVIAQVFHIPFNQFALNPALQDLSLAGGLGGWNLVWVSIALGLSAGVFEETARYLVYRFWIKHARTWKAGLMFGAGHGGIEAILVGVLALLTVFQMMAVRNGDLSTLVQPEQLELAQAQVAAFWETPWYIFLLGAYERIMAISFHLAAAILVLQAFLRNNKLWVGAAILWHTSFNATVLFVAQTYGAVQAEGVATIFGVASLWMLFRLRTNDESDTEIVPPSLIEIKPTQITADDLENSQYDQ
jgi:uncharacterized membrane protein YhfC